MRYVVLFFALFSIVYVSANEFEVREFKKDPTDLAARRFEKRTVNDEPCALIKVTTNVKGMQFEANLGIVDIVHQDDGYWIYVQPRERSIKLMATGYLSMDMPMPEPAVAHVVYNLVIAAKGMMQTTDLVRVTFRFNQENVYVRLGDNQAPVLASGRSAVFNVTRGVHRFRFIKDQFNDQELELDVQGELVREVVMEAGQTSTRIPLSGHILLATNPAGAEVYLNDQQVGISPYQGRNVAGSYQLRVKHPFYHDHIEQFELREGETVTLPAIELKPRFGYVQVESSPSGAEVWVDGKLEGTTPLVRKQISSGQHSLTLRLSDYHEHNETFTINDGDTKTFSVEMKEAFGSFAINSDPTDATVFINGKEVGKTPFSQQRFPSGNYELRLVKDLHVDARDRLVVKDGEKSEKFIVLPQNYGTLTVTAEGSDIFLNGKAVGFGAYSANISAGSYALKASRDKHRNDERELFITNGQAHEITLSPVAIMGALSVTTTPFEAAGASVTLNGNLRPEKTPTTIPLIIGNYELMVSKPGYLDQRRQVTVIEGQEQEVVLAMQTFEGSMLQQAHRYNKAKLFYGSMTLAALGSGGYFRYSTLKLADEYKTATTNATSIYDTMERHNLYTTISVAVAAPLAVMTVVKMIQHNKVRKRINVAVLPSQDGMNIYLSMNL